jgi:hypothetical protein
LGSREICDTSIDYDLLFTIAAQALFEHTDNHHPRGIRERLARLKDHLTNGRSGMACLLEKSRKHVCEEHFDILRGPAAAEVQASDLSG